MKKLINPLKRIVLFAATLLGGSAQAIQYCSNANMGLAIPDNNTTGVSNSITVPSTATGSATGMQVSINGRHTYVGDLIFSLQKTSPAVAAVTLANRLNSGGGTCSGDNFNFTLDSSLSTPLVQSGCTSSTTLALSGTFAPANSMNTLASAARSGTWQITVSDRSGQDTGYLDQWCLIFPDPTVTAVADSSTTPMNTAVNTNVLSNDTATGSSLDPSSVTVTTAPAHGTVSVNTTTGAITYTPALNYTGSDGYVYKVCQISPNQTVCGSANVTITIPVSADLQLTKTNNGGTADQPADTLTAGSDSIYTIRVTNVGALSVSSATLNDPAAANLTVNTVVCSAASGNTCTSAPTVAQLQGVFTLPNLAPNAFYELLVTARVTTTVGATVANTATVTLPSGFTELTPANNTATDSDTTVSSPSVATLTCDVNAGEMTQSFVFPAGSWTTGATNNTANPYVISTSGLTTNLTFNITNALPFSTGNIGANPTLYTTGNTPNSLAVSHAATSGNTLLDTFNIDFSRLVNKVQFSVKDVDYTANSWQDRIVGRNVTASQQLFDYTGTANCDSTSAACNYPASSGTSAPLTQMAVDFYAGPGVSSPGGQFIAYNDFSWCALVPVLTIGKTHSGNFDSGKTGTYTLTVTNAGQVATSGNIVVEDALPTGMTVSSVTSSAGTVATTGTSSTPIFTISGATLGAGQSLTLTLTVNAPPNLTSQQTLTNKASVGGGGDPDTRPSASTCTVGTTNPSNQCAGDSTIINPAVPDLSIVKTGPSGQTGSTPNYAQPSTTSPVLVRSMTYQMTVSNASGTAIAPSNGTVTVTDTLPSGLTATAISGTGWSCTLSTLTCTRSDTLAVGSSYPAISVTVTAPTDATLEGSAALRSITNTGAVSGGGDSNTSNNTSTALTQMAYAKLVKSVRNFTKNTAFDVKADGLPTEVLEYCIAFTNYGAVALPNFKVEDNVPTNTNARMNAYGSAQSIKITRSVPPAAASTSYLNTLTTSGGLGSGVMTANLGTLALGETGSVCFQATIK